MHSPAVLRVLASLILVTGCTASKGVEIISPFGSLYATDGVSRRGDGPHRGVDIWGRVGDPVLAPAVGTVAYAAEEAVSRYPTCGTMITIRHLGSLGGYMTLYCHLGSVAVTVGDAVRRREIIGYIGVTGETRGKNHPSAVHVHLARTIHER